MLPVGSAENPCLVAIVGSGPSGFYAAEALLRLDIAVQINIIEKLPTPFGLVRYGVAPDHPKLKQVSLVFDKIARHPSIRFYGNVDVGNTVTLGGLCATHHAVILCYGAAVDRRLGVPGEDLPGSHAATEFVGWYNGHPDYRDRTFDFSSEDAVVIGQGNVAADVCRILGKSVDELRRTDIAAHALEQLAESKIRRIHVVGRRGPAQAKFTAKELRELGDISGVTVQIAAPGLSLDPEDAAELANPANDNAKKCVALFESFSNAGPARSDREVNFHFNLSPKSFFGDQHLQSVNFFRNRLVGAPFARKAVPTSELFSIDGGLCLRCVGYCGQALKGLPFDLHKGIVPNQAGQVINSRGTPMAGLFVSGWIKRGPSGVIGTNRADSIETVETLSQYIAQLDQTSAIDLRSFEELLSEHRDAVINYDDWKQIDAVEMELGMLNGKPREKFTHIADMLGAARRHLS